MAVSQHDVDAVALEITLARTGGRRHGMAIDQDVAREVVARGGQQLAERLMVGPVEPLDSRRGVGKAQFVGVSSFLT